MNPAATAHDRNGHAPSQADPCRVCADAPVAVLDTGEIFVCPECVGEMPPDPQPVPPLGEPPAGRHPPASKSPLVAAMARRIRFLEEHVSDQAQIVQYCKLTCKGMENAVWKLTEQLHQAKQELTCVREELREQRTVYELATHAMTNGYQGTDD